MAISNYTTKIDSGKTIGEISGILAKHKATKIMTDYDDGIPIALTFQIETAKGAILFQLPANYLGVLRALEKDSAVPKALRTKEQALRVAWRILRDWVEAQMAIVEAELAAVEQVFLPYAMLKSGRTVYESVGNNDFLQLGQ